MTKEVPTPAQPAAASPPEEKDIQERIAGFNKEIVPLLGKYELGLAAMPRITPDGRTVADPIIVSVRGRTDLPQTATPNAAPATPEPPKSGLATGE